MADDFAVFAVRDKEGKVIAEFGASSDTAAAIVFLVEEAAKAQREKVAAWMVAHGFATGHGDTLEDLLRELSPQIKDLRKQSQKRAFDAGWDGAIRWTRTPYPGNLGNLVYAESLKKLFEM
jgi:NAD(P)H-dependent flavin oxidoreductase YrpB (nitropropane dioxygenase family)